MISFLICIYKNLFFSGQPSRDYQSRPSTSRVMYFFFKVYFFSLFFYYTYYFWLADHPSISLVWDNNLNYTYKQCWNIFLQKGLNNISEGILMRSFWQLSKQFKKKWFFFKIINIPFFMKRLWKQKSIPCKFILIFLHYYPGKVDGTS